MKESDNGNTLGAGSKGLGGVTFAAPQLTLEAAAVLVTGAVWLWWVTELGLF